VSRGLTSLLVASHSQESSIFKYLSVVMTKLLWSHSPYLGRAPVSGASSMWFTCLNDHRPIVSSSSKSPSHIGTPIRQAESFSFRDKFSKIWVQKTNVYVPLCWGLRVSHWLGRHLAPFRPCVQILLPLRLYHQPSCELPNQWICCDWQIASRQEFFQIAVAEQAEETKFTMLLGEYNPSSSINPLVCSVWVK
jgi:hypothetical protein